MMSPVMPLKMFLHNIFFGNFYEFLSIDGVLFPFL